MNRRRFLANSALTALPLAWQAEPAQAESTFPASPFTPEANATLEVFCWKRYIAEDEEQYMENVALFTKLTGVKVNVRHINILELGWAIDDVYFGRKHVDVVLGLDGEAYRYKDLWMPVNDLEAILAPVIGK